MPKQPTEDDEAPDSDEVFESLAALKAKPAAKAKASKAPTLSRGLGFLPDKAEHLLKSPSVRHLFGGRMGVPHAASLEEHVQEVRDQGQTSRCVAFGQTSMASIRLSKSTAGGTKRRFSANALYAFGRRYERAGGQLQDVGSSPTLLQLASIDWGLVEESVWPSDLSTVNVDPPMDVLQVATEFSLPQSYTLDSEGDALIADIKQAISTGYPVGYGTYVGQVFGQYTGGILMPDRTVGGGGHYTVLVGYEGDEFIGLNSWGLDWGNHGFYRCGPAWLLDERASQFQVTQVGGYSAKPKP